MNKNYTKQIISGAKIVILALFVAIGMNYAFAFVGPTAGAPGENVAAPINTSSTNQVKDIGGCTASACGGISVGTFVANKAAQFFDIVKGDADSNVKFGKETFPAVRANIKVAGDGYFVNTPAHKANVGIGTNTPDVNTGLTIDLTGRTVAQGTDGIKITSTASATASNIVINKANFGVWSTANNNWADANFRNLTLNALNEANNADVSYPANICVDTNGKLVNCSGSSNYEDHIVTLESGDIFYHSGWKSCPADHPHAIGGGGRCYDDNIGGGIGEMNSSQPATASGGDIGTHWTDVSSEPNAWFVRCDDNTDIVNVWVVCSD